MKKLNQIFLYKMEKAWYSNLIIGICLQSPRHQNMTIQDNLSSLSFTILIWRLILSFLRNIRRLREFKLELLVDNSLFDKSQKIKKKKKTQKCSIITTSLRIDDVKKIIPYNRKELIVAMKGHNPMQPNSFWGMLLILNQIFVVHMPHYLLAMFIIIK